MKETIVNIVVECIPDIILTLLLITCYIFTLSLYGAISGWIIGSITYEIWKELR